MSIYLSDDRPRWQPTTEAELRSVTDAGLLQETHYLDAKREIGDSGGPRKETARDLASFAIDGGGLVIGVEENKEERTWTLAPQPLNGLAERVESIATHLVDPPLFVVTTDIPSESDPTQGYLYVYVPPSPRAPHMVDGIYFARGDRQRTRLSDAEVVRHHSRREPLEQLGHRLLDDEIARDHVPAEKQTLGHLYLVAQPLTPRHEMAREFVRGHPGDLINMLRDPERHLPPPVRGIVPSLAYLTSHRSRANGVSWCSSAAMGPGRSIVDEPGYDGEEGLLDVELREDGGVRLVAGRMTMQYGGSRLGAPTAVIVDSVTGCSANAAGIRTGTARAAVRRRTGRASRAEQAGRTEPATRPSSHWPRTSGGWRGLSRRAACSSTCRTPLAGWRSALAPTVPWASSYTAMR